MSDTAVEHFVVVNDEQQYSVWLADRALPEGWWCEGFAGPLEDCIAHIEAVWTDMRPASLRRSMQETTGEEAAREPV